MSKKHGNRQAYLDSTNIAAELVHHKALVVLAEHKFENVTADNHRSADNALYFHISHLLSASAANEILDDIRSGISKPLAFTADLVARLGKQNVYRVVSLVTVLLVLLVAWLLSPNKVPHQPALTMLETPIPVAVQDIQALAAPTLTLAHEETATIKPATVKRAAATTPSIYVLNPPESSENILVFKPVFDDLLSIAALEKLGTHAHVIYLSSTASMEHSGSLSKVAGNSGGISKSAVNLNAPKSDVQFHAPTISKVKSFLSDAEILNTLRNDKAKLVHTGAPI